MRCVECAGAPGFTVVMVLTLALGIGANTAIFSLVNQILLHPRGISHPERLVVVRTKYAKLNLKSITDSPPTLADVRDSREVFEHAAAMRGTEVNYTGGAVPQSLRAEAVSVEWFDVFGAKPSLGRVFYSGRGSAQCRARRCLVALGVGADLRRGPVGDQPQD
ncbi:MAG TPA: ABC transporter permease [Bryobacteraceae bacterium]|jgi:hypothetical protein